MIWTDDKIKHYNFCYNVVNKTPKGFKNLSAIVVIIGGILKEFIDATGLGTPEIDDIKANFLGATDALNSKKSRLKWEAQV